MSIKWTEKRENQIKSCSAWLGERPLLCEWGLTDANNLKFDKKGKGNAMTLSERRALVESFLGKVVDIKIDRSIGYIHKKGEKILYYPINYGFIENVLGGDGEELDVYLLGVDKPVSEYKVQIIGAVFRENDVEDKLIAAPVGMTFSVDEIEEQIHFQEKYYITHVETI